MSTAAALTLSEAIIPLKQSFNPEDLRTTKVEHSWTTTGQNPQTRTAKMYLPICDDPSKKELFLYVIDQFFDACDNSRLHLSTGDSRYNKFRQVLDGSLRIDWQTISTGRANKTTDTFLEDIHALISMYFSDSSRMDQLTYLTKTTKPFNMTVAETSSRLNVINLLGRLLPGSWADDRHSQANLFGNDTEKKRALFHIMPMAWRVKFAETAHQLDAATYTYAQLTQYMALQEAIERSARGQKRPRQFTSGGRGGGRGRGRSRGRGRGDFGRGYGRGFSRGFNRAPGGYGNYNNYTPGALTSPNPYQRAAQGGRFGGGRGYMSPVPGRAGFQTPRSNVPRVSNSPRRQMVRGRGGPGPQIPQFMAEDHYYHQQEDPQAPQDQYYQDDSYYQADEQYYAGDGGYLHTDEQYYQQPQVDEHYYAGEDEQQGSQEQEQQEEDAHWLSEFGY